VLGVRSGKPDKDWDELGIWPFPPPYHKGTYNNTECEVNASETDLFLEIEKAEKEKDKTEQRLPVAMKAIEYAIKRGLTPDPDKDQDEIDEELYALIDNNLVPGSKVPIIDLKYFAKYIKKAGFKFAIDGFHNLTQKGIFIVIYCLNPPGVFYKDTISEKDAWEVL